MTEQDVFRSAKNFFSAHGVNANITLRQNKNGESAFLVDSKPVFWMDLSPKKHYLRFRPYSKEGISEVGVTILDFSENMVKLDFSNVEESTSSFERLLVALLASYKAAHPKDQFGCCHQYVECSDAGKCLHPDQIYSLSCQYRKNLENGKIFYGKNRNVK